MNNAMDKLISKIKETNNPTVMGLDPRYDMIPGSIRAKYEKNVEGACKAILEFNKGLIDSVYDIIPAVKPQIAFYEMFGVEGLKVFEETCKYSKEKACTPHRIRYDILEKMVLTEIKKMFIGIKNGSKIGKGKKYVNEKPVVFYGSSITHGAAAGRPGNTYESFISQKYNLNYTNLGFAGGAKGQTVMAEHIASLEMSAFVCDYDHNAPDAKHLEATHYPFYEIIRKKHPDIPYIMISRPDGNINSKFVEKSNERKSVIINSYQKAKDNGDENVYFIDGDTLFDGEFYYSCTSDGAHPNDIGFMRMADKIGMVIKNVMNLK